MLEQETVIPSFTSKNESIAELLDYMHEIEDLKALGNLAEWDQNTEMPKGAAEVRGYQMAALQGILHERWTTQRLGVLLSELSEVTRRSDYSDADRGLVREAQRTLDVAPRGCRGRVAFETERRHRDRPAVVDRTDHLIRRHAHVGEEHLGEAGAPVELDDRPGFNPVRSHVDRDERDARVPRRLGVGSHEREDPVGERTVGRPDLLTVDDEILALANRASLETREVAPGVGFGEALGPHVFGREDAPDPTLLLFFGAVRHERRAHEVEAEDVDALRSVRE